MTTTELIERYKIQDGHRRGGPKGSLFVPEIKKLSTGQVAEIKANKAAIAAEFERREAEREQREAEARQKAIEDQRPLRKLAVVRSGSYLLDLELCYVVPLSDDEKAQYAEWVKQANPHKTALDREPVDLKAINKSATVQFLTARKRDGILCYGESALWLVTEEQAAELRREVAERNAAATKAEQERQTAVAKGRSDAIEKAKRTGEPVVIETWMEECSDPHEECSTDVVNRVATPDGRIEVHRAHTW